MELPLARLDHCLRCGRQFLICSRCDRGQHYCGPACARAARSASVRAAGKRYQAGLAGRHTHAARQRRYRARKAKVTHQGSPPQAADGAMPAGSMAGVDETLTPPVPVTATGASSTEFPAPPTHCRCCGRLCAPLVRQGFLRHRRAPRTVIVSDLRGAVHDPFP